MWRRGRAASTAADGLQSNTKPALAEKQSRRWRAQRSALSSLFNVVIGFVDVIVLIAVFPMVWGLAKRGGAALKAEP